MQTTTRLISEGNTYNNICDGIIEDNILKFEENGIKVSFDLDNNKLIRESDAFYMEYSFIKDKETVNTIFIKDMNKELNINIFTSIMDKSDGFIDIEYKLVDNNNVIRYIINYGG